jgi:large subunit ribosomal protein L21
MVADDGGVKVGTPLVPGASVTAEVVEQYRGKKIRGFTYKPTKNIRRRFGHRQSLTRLRVVEIKACSAQDEPKAAG